MNLGAAATADLLRRHEVRPLRRLGQHFVIDPNTIRRILRLAEVTPGDRVVEIGAGCGALTAALADAGAEVLAIEIDRRLLGALKEACAGRNVKILTADATDQAAWASHLEGRGEWKLVSNLPYNLAAPLVLDVLATLPKVVSMLVMVQAEVAERLAAAPGDESYGLTSLKLACRARAKVLGRVPPTVFWPRPGVSSALLSVRRLPRPAVDNTEALCALAAKAFAKRRKMLRTSLRGIVGPQAFAVAEVDSTRRPEELGTAEWSRLASAAGNGSRGGPSDGPSDGAAGGSSDGPSGGASDP